jgi:ketosteroid isomerase-like protein
MQRLPLLAALALSLAACAADPSTAPAGGAPSLSRAEGEGAEASARAHLDLRELRAGLLATDRAHAAAAAGTNLVEALVAPLAPDGVFIGPGPGFARGPEAARALLLLNPNNPLSTWSWTAIRVDVSSDGTRGYSYGYTELTLPTGVVLPGKYLAYWARQSDGSWKMAAYKRTPRAPGAVSLTPPAGFETPDTKHRRYFPNTDPAAELELIKATDRAFSDLAQITGNAEAFARYVAEDGANAGSGASVEWAFGPDAIRAAHEGEPPGLFFWTPELGDVAASGDLGFTVGYVKVNEQNPDGSVSAVIVAKYLTIWQKQRTGEWRFVVDG